MKNKLKVKYIGYKALCKINAYARVLLAVFFLYGILVIISYCGDKLIRHIDTRLGIFQLLFGIFICLYAIIGFTMFFKINDFTIINIYTGCLHMKSNEGKEKLRSTKNNIAILDSLMDEFIDAIYLVPQKTKYCPFRIYKKEIYTKTHEVIVKKAEKIIKSKGIINPFQKIYIGEKAIKEKLFKYSYREISNLDETKKSDKRVIEGLNKKSKEYKIIIQIADIEKYKNS